MRRVRDVEPPSETLLSAVFSNDAGVGRTSAWSGDVFFDEDRHAWWRFVDSAEETFAATTYADGALWILEYPDDYEGLNGPYTLRGL